MVDPTPAAPAAAVAPAAPTTPPPAAAPAAVPGQQGTPAPQAQASKEASPSAQPTDPAKPQTQPPAAPGLAIKLPDGMKADQKFVDGYLTVAKKAGLSQEQAQGVVDFYVKNQTEQAKVWEQALTQQVAKDEATLKADKDFGGVKYDSTLKAADQAISHFFGDEGVKLFKDLGIHRNPVIAKGLARAAAAIAEDSIGDKGKQPAPAAETREAELKKMFPNSYDQMVKEAPRR